jgi:hypothetical protein
LTPKSEAFPLIVPAYRTHVISILVPNIVCTLLHIFSPLTEGSEETRGYLHGGIIIDYVGQKAPTSRLGLLLLDLAVLGLQCLMLSIHSERERVRRILRPFTTVLQAAGGEVTQPAVTTEDHDAEERGVTRDIPDERIEDGDGIEMQQLRNTTSNRERREQGERDPLVELNEALRERNSLSDILSSGNGVLGEFHVIHTLRTAATDYQSTAAQSLQTLGYTAAMAAIARRRAQLARPR